MAKLMRNLAVALVLLITITIGWVYLGLPGFIKEKFEPTLTELNGAEVNVNGIGVSLLPLGFSVKNIQVTDAKTPSHNTVAVQDIKAEIALMPLFSGSLVMDKLLVNDLKFNQKRAAPGRVLDPVVEEESSVLEDMEQAIKNQLKSENLLTVQRYNDLQQSIKQHQAQVETSYANLPDQAKLDLYQKQLKQIQDDVKSQNVTKMMQAKDNFKKLRKEMKADQQNLKALREQIQVANKDLKQDYKLLRQAPSQDWQNIADKYQVNNLAQVMLGAEQAEMLKRFFENKDKVEPPSDKTVADFVIKQGLVNLGWDNAEFSLDLDEITAQNYFTEQKSKIGLVSKTQGVTADGGGWYFVDRDKTDGDGQWVLDNLPLSDLMMSESDALMLELKQGLLASTGSYTLGPDGVHLKLNLVIKQPKFSAEGEKSWVSDLQTVLNNSAEIKFEYEIKQQGDEWQSSQRSNIDRLMGDLVKQSAMGELDKYKQQFTSELQTKYLKDVNVDGLFNAQEAGLGDIEKTLENLLKQELSKNKLLDGLFGKG